ncbi:MAG: HAMP domain-containing protein [Deltaproteobacteria bacterium]|nr:HAMP domain-containing protein [Deltaproteobacteria bacterium]
MRLARKLIVSMIIGVTLVLAANAYYRVRRELAAFDEDMRRDHEVLARVLGRAVATVWECSGREAALQIVVAAKPASEMVHIRWLDEQSLRLRTRAEDLLYTDVPIAVAGDLKGYIEIRESRTFEETYVRTTLVRTLVLTLLAVLGAGVLSTVVGVYVVGHPTRKLVDKARRIGEGKLEDPPLAIAQRDEIGLLADEMNAMSLRLAETRYALEAETTELLRTQEQLRRADRLATVGKLASGIAHELGTPLGVALVRANMIAANESLGREVRDAARIVSEQIDRITRIVRQLLDFARGHGEPPPGALAKRTPANLVAIAQRSAAMLQPLAAKRNVTIAVVTAPTPPEPPANEDQIQQVLVNLVVNAVHAARGPGKVTITVGIKQVKLPADVTPVVWGGDAEPQYAVISVQDEGVGIAPELLPRIFEPFFTTKDVGEGTGLGLSVAYGIVREHGGWIDVTSEPEKGSSFSVYLPMSVAELV